MKEIKVLTENPYSVYAGRGILDILPQTLHKNIKKVLIVHQPSMANAAEVIKDMLDAEVFIAEVPDKEAAKRIEVCSFLWDLLSQNSFNRNDAIIALGGGAVTDMAGFVASAYLRGIKVYHIPTTVLAMSDAAVGGKTGINIASGKNLVGAFYEPSAVICDTQFLDTLDKDEIRSGSAEIIKCGFIGKNNILELYINNPGDALNTQSDIFFKALTSAISHKADVVAQDLKESNLREFLNYGHTLGHAIEHNLRYKYKHGFAVAIGMLFAANLSYLTGNLDMDAVETHKEVLNILGLPMTYSRLAWERLHETMKIDKKTRANILRFVILDKIGSPKILEAPPSDLLYSAYLEIAS